MTDYRAVFDATVAFSNSGSLSVTDFRVDVASPDVDEAHVAQLFLTSLGLLMAAQVDVRNLSIVEELHKGTRGGPSDRSAQELSACCDFMELSHVISAGLTTYPGLPAPEITPHLTRDASRGVYAPGTEFAIDRISMVGNTGTYLDSPFHRYPNGADLAGLPLSRLVDLPAVVVRTFDSGRRVVDAETLAPYDVAGKAVLLHTGGDAHWATPSYVVDAPYLTESGARLLVERGAALVGIDSVNIDDAVPGGDRPAHTLLLAAGIPIVEHLTNLGALPPNGARFTAAPPLVAGFGTFPVRAYAAVPAG